MLEEPRPPASTIATPELEQEEASWQSQIERSSTPEPTRQRWQQRLRERATMLVVILAQLGPARSAAVRALGLGAARREVIDAFGLARLAALAALVDRLAPGVRVM